MLAATLLLATFLAAPSEPCRAGERAYLGIHVRAGAEHVEVVAIDAESPASTSGLAPGDRLIAVNGTTLKSAEALEAIVAARCPGQKIILKSSDAYGFRETLIVLEALPTNDAPKLGEVTTAREARVTGGWNDWYGWKIAVADVSSVGLLSVGLGMEAGEIAVFSLGTAGLSAPIIHLTHENPVRALGSLGLRIGLPALGVFFARNVACGNRCDWPGSEDSANALSLFGGALGFLAASLIDIFALGWDQYHQPSDNMRLE